MPENVCLTYYKKNKELISAKNQKYYQRNKDRLSTQGRERYWGLSKEKKNERLEYDNNRRESITEEDKDKRRAYIRGL